MGQHDPANSLDDLVGSVWVLAALAAAGDGEPLSEELGAVLHAGGYAERTPGGWALLPPYRNAARSRTFSRQVADTLRQAADAAEGTPDAAKEDHDLIADGELSGAQLAEIVDHLEARLPAMHELLRRTDLRFLDLGVGVGGIAGAVLERVPTATAVGLDIDERMLRLAADRLADMGLSARVELRRQNVTTLTDRHCYDLAWLPLVALSPDDALAALPRIRTALRPGGWIVTATALPAGDPGSTAPDLPEAIVRWRTARRGVACWDTDELTSQLESAGYREVHVSRAGERGMTSVAAQAPT